MKVLGQVKNLSNAQYYSNISYIETCKINNINVHEVLIKLLEDNPYNIEEILHHIIQKIAINLAILITE